MGREIPKREENLQKPDAPLSGRPHSTKFLYNPPEISRESKGQKPEDQQWKKIGKPYYETLWEREGVKRSKELCNVSGLENARDVWITNSIEMCKRNNVPYDIYGINQEWKRIGRSVALDNFMKDQERRFMESGKQRFMESYS